MRGKGYPHVFTSNQSLVDGNQLCRSHSRTNVTSSTPFPATSYSIQHKLRCISFSIHFPLLGILQPHIRSPFPEPVAIHISDKHLQLKPLRIFASSSTWLSNQADMSLLIGVSADTIGKDIKSSNWSAALSCRIVGLFMILVRH